ncbi:MAG: STAS domain-containing protein [Candidatus Ozemobacteraceae bacterium]
MSVFSLEMDIIDGITILLIKGYFGFDAGSEATKLVEHHLGSGERRFVIDFSECRLISSPGVVDLLVMICKIEDDFGGRVIITGLDPLKTSLLEMAGVIPGVESAYDRATGIELLRKG